MKQEVQLTARLRQQSIRGDIRRSLSLTQQGIDQERVIAMRGPRRVT